MVGAFLNHYASTGFRVYYHYLGFGGRILYFEIYQVLLRKLGTLSDGKFIWAGGFRVWGCGCRAEIMGCRFKFIPYSYIAQ